MPIYTYRFHDNGEERDEFFTSWRHAPQLLIVKDEELGMRLARKVPARFAAHLPNEKILAAARRGLIPFESGMERDAARARKYIEERQDRERRESIAKTLADFPT